jgi:hypothetical protein
MYKTLEFHNVNKNNLQMASLFLIEEEIPLLQHSLVVTNTLYEGKVALRKIYLQKLISSYNFVRIPVLL